MKDNLEKAFKNSLEEYEVPYDPKAWDAVNAQLNANAAAGGSVISSALKWVLASVLLGTVVTGSYFLWYNDDNTQRTQTAIVEDEKEDKITSTIKEESELKEEVLVDGNEQEIELVQIQDNANKVNAETSQNVIPVQPKKGVNEEAVKTTNGDTPIERKIPSISTNKETLTFIKYVSGRLSRPVVCLGETVEISNDSKTNKVRFKLNDEWVVLTAGKSLIYSPEESVVINFVIDKNELIEAKYLKVNEASVPDFNFEANIYEEGLPVVIAEAFGDYVSYSWNFNEETETKGTVVKYHFFEKGDFNITLNVEDINGCKAVTTKTVRIRDKYNLMAVDAFKPNGSDVRNRAFMPYSLTERDVRFQMTIVDPIDNGVVFTSSDAASAWDGTDQRTGKMTPSNKSFIWKVQIFNPEENERPIYAGTVVHN